MGRACGQGSLSRMRHQRGRSPYPVAIPSRLTLPRLQWNRREKILEKVFKQSYKRNVGENSTYLFCVDLKSVLCRIFTCYFFPFSPFSLISIRIQATQKSLIFCVSVFIDTLKRFFFKKKILFLKTIFTFSSDQGSYPQLRR